MQLQSCLYKMWPEPAVAEGKSFRLCLQWGVTLELAVDKQYEAWHTLLHAILKGRNNEERSEIKIQGAWNLSTAQKMLG